MQGLGAGGKVSEDEGASRCPDIPQASAAGPLRPCPPAAPALHNAHRLPVMREAMVLQPPKRGGTWKVPLCIGAVEPVTRDAAAERFLVHEIRHRTPHAVSMPLHTPEA